VAWLWRAGRPDKHMVYFDVLEALAEPGCPVCRLGLTSVARYLDALSYESVNDPGVREQLRGARGFCNLHAWQFADLRNGLGAAIIYHDVLGALLRQVDEELARVRGRVLPPLERLVAGHGNAWALPGRLLPHRLCPACRVLAEAHERHLGALVAHLGDDELRAAYLGADGLCLPHLAMVAPRLGEPQDVALLVDVAASRLTSLASADVWAATRFAAGAPGAVASPPRPRVARDAEPTGDEQALESALRRPGCPVCRVTGQGVDRFLAALPARTADDRTLAAELTGARGLCNRHGWRLAAHGAASPTGALAGLAELGGVLEAAAAGAREPRRGAALAAELRPRAPCPACREEAETERRAVGGLLDALARTDVMVRFGKSSGLCMAHFALAVGLATDRRPQRARLLVGQANVWHRLRAELAEYIRKQDYRYADEAWGAEADAPERAIAAVAGIRELPTELVGDPDATALHTTPRRSTPWPTSR
jgi:hypothetical protein